MRITDYKKLHDDIVDWLHKYAQDNDIEAFVVGLSGGIDSAVTAMLCIDASETYKDTKTFCVMMPYDLQSDAESYVRSLKFKNNVEFVGADVSFSTYEIKSVADAYHLNSPIPNSIKIWELLAGNLRARIRANVLYHYAGFYKGIVVGTDNLDENELGYFTKGGDGLTDVLPIGDLHKYEVYELAKVCTIDIPQEIIDAKPSAGLWPGQTDEDELGMTYHEIAWAIDVIRGNGNHLDPLEPTRAADVIAKVKEIMRKTEHKRSMQPVFKIKG